MEGDCHQGSSRFPWSEPISTAIPVTHCLDGFYFRQNGSPIAGLLCQKMNRYVIAGMWGGLIVLGLFSFQPLLSNLCTVWLQNEEFSYGIAIPIISVSLIWSRYKKAAATAPSSWTLGLALAFIGCGLQILASMSGTLLLSCCALVLTLLGAVGFLWGKCRVALVAGPVALLILMVPPPTYVIGELSWHLESVASTVSGSILNILNVIVYQDGNLLRLPNYVLEVKEACSGSRSIFALVTLACVMGLSTKQKMWVRILLVLAAPILAVSANVIRIVGTGLIAKQWGSLAANESLHSAWGLAVFLIAVLGLRGLQKLLRWTAFRIA